MHVYFVRHGETDLNRRHIHQSPNTPLSSRGREQIATVAESLRGVNADLLVSSEYTRALESARIIGQYTGLVPVANGLFYEIVRPSSFYHCSIFSLETFWFVLTLLIHRNDPKWRYKDAENAADIAERAKRALSFLESQRGKYRSIIVVSHTAFTQVMISYMCRNTMLSVFDLLKLFFRSGRMQNGGIAHLVYEGDGSRNTCNWRTVENNDAH